MWYMALAITHFGMGKQYRSFGGGTLKFPLFGKNFAKSHMGGWETNVERAPTIAPTIVPTMAPTIALTTIVSNDSSNNSSNDDFIEELLIITKKNI
ncbi:hypothetical protein C2G38_2213807 [Gigaspora rosea]|uniref:Uncharacterized protein n=1 Tax=Gigaspora rosea TaxID=44941 RepID=A0A397UF11_9GLOM|nr:hypothetical protein C2G38_2213807 [Gigaspora rosea]